MNNEILKISGKSNPKAIAGAIVGQIKEKQSPELKAIGAAAVNQAVKSLAIARGYAAPLGIDITVIPAFMNIQSENEEITGIKFIVKVDE